MVPPIFPTPPTTVEKRHNLCPCAVVVQAEGRGTGADGRTLAHGLLSCTDIVRAVCHVPEEIAAGERRLYLLSVLMPAPNVLLDEPTNDLDVTTLAILEDYLSTFPGPVIAVAHDRFFLDKMAEQIFEVTGDGAVRRYSGNWSDYDHKRREAELAEQMERCGSDYIKLQELTERYTALQAALEEKTERWMYLNELKEQIDGRG